MGSLNVLIAVLAVRLTLLVAVCGAFALAWMAVQTHDAYPAVVMFVYAAVVVCPLIWLAAS
jgi:ABC-type glycerol-3-phosphate transport system permease component